MRYMLLCLLLLVFMPVTAQEMPVWSAWIENNQTYTRVYSDGQQRTIALNLPENYVQHGYPHPSNNGDLFALCAQVGNQFHALIYDTIAEATIYDYPLGTTQSCHTMLDETNTRIAVVLMDDTMDFGRQLWRMQIIDTSTSQIVTQIAAGDYDAGAEFWLIGPALETFAGDSVTFTAASELGDGPSTRTFQWLLTDNLIEGVGAIASYYVTVLPSTGESIWSASDHDLPEVYIGGLGPNENVIQTYGSDGTPINIFHSPYKVVLGSEFIDDGRKIAISISDLGDSHWVYIDREGQQFPLPFEFVDNYISVRGPIGTSDGFILLTASNDNYQRIVHYRFIGDQWERRVLLWWIPIQIHYASLIWITPMQGQSDLAPLASMEMVTLNEPQPTPTPLPPTPTLNPFGYG